MGSDVSPCDRESRLVCFDSTSFRSFTLIDTASPLSTWLLNWSKCVLCRDDYTPISVCEPRVGGLRFGRSKVDCAMLKCSSCRLLSCTRMFSVELCSVPLRFILLFTV